MNNLDVAKNPETSAKVLVKLVDDSNWVVRGLIAENPETSAEVLEKLSNDTDNSVRWGVARHLNTPPEALKKLAFDSNWEVRMYVAKNPNTPTVVLDKLSRDPKLMVRWGVAKNPKTPTTILVELSNDNDSWVREGVARHPNTPQEALEKLASDVELPVRRNVLEREDITLPFIKEHFPKNTWENAECLSVLLKRFGEAALPVWLGDAVQQVIKRVKDTHGNPLTLFKVTLKGRRGATTEVKCLLCYCPSQQAPFFLIPPDQGTNDPEVARKSTFPKPLDARQGDVGIHYNTLQNKVTLPLGGIIET